MNVIFFITDQQRADHLGCAGNPIVKTPNIDRLASEGVLFTNGYVANPTCMPNRASIMTGQYPARLHLTDFIAGKKAPHEKLLLPEWTKYLPNEADTIAERLRAAGL